VCVPLSLSLSLSLFLHLSPSLSLCEMWPSCRACAALLLHCLGALLVCGSADAFTILSPFSYSSLSFKNLLNSVLLSSNANLAGGGRNLKSDVLEDASLITVSIKVAPKIKQTDNNNGNNNCDNYRGHLD